MPRDERVAQPGLVGAALRGRDRVAVGVAEAVVLVLGPGDRPFDAAAASGEVGLADERAAASAGRASVEARREKIAEPAREMQPRLGRDVRPGRGSAGSQLQRISTPRNR